MTARLRRSKYFSGCKNKKTSRNEVAKFLAASFFYVCVRSNGKDNLDDKGFDKIIAKCFIADHFTLRLQSKSMDRMMRSKMKITKPNLVNELVDVADLQELVLLAKVEESDIVARQIKDGAFADMDLSKVRFREVLFENCTFNHGSFIGTEFIDVVFNACDLSNSDFSDGYFNRCQFMGCKGVGINLINANLQQVTIAGSNFKYANFSTTKLKNVHVVGSDISKASITECKLSNLVLEDVKLISISFFQTPLKGIDFTKSQIDGLVVSGGELRGAIVSADQATELAKLLGVVVK